MWSIVRDPHDSKETITCAFRSVALFTGLGLNCLSGFWRPIRWWDLSSYCSCSTKDTKDGRKQGRNRQTEILNRNLELPAGVPA